MSEVYNPETLVYEKLAALELEAGALARRREHGTPEDRLILQRQLREVEDHVERIKQRLRMRLRV